MKLLLLYTLLCSVWITNSFLCWSSIFRWRYKKGHSLVTIFFGQFL